jgi:hypothetical protein
MPMASHVRDDVLSTFATAFLTNIRQTRGSLSRQCKTAEAGHETNRRVVSNAEGGKRAAQTGEGRRCDDTAVALARRCQ